MWTVSWQDFRRHAFGDPMPPIERETFETKEAADRRKGELKLSRVVVCVTPLVIRRRRQKPVLDAEGPIFQRGMEAGEVTIIVTIPTPPSLNKLWVTAPGKPRVRSSEYRAWAERAGWLLRMQIVGMAPLDCRFNLDIEVPISRRDTGNHEKALCDLCESCGVVTNDGNAHRISVTPTERTDCLLVFTPLPEMGAVRRPAPACVRATRMRRHAPKRRALTWKMPA